MVGGKSLLVHTISLTVGLAVLWWLLSGFTLPLILGLGAASIVLVVYISHRMDVVDHEGHPIQVSWRALLYFPWLTNEILKANIDVAKTICFPGRKISPTVIRVSASQKTELGHVIYANSITLTPGTVTIEVEDGVMTVHALNEEAAAGLKTGDMDRRCTEVEGLSSTEEA